MTTPDDRMNIELNREHSWNLDVTLAKVLDQGLTMLMDGVAEQPDDMERARNLFRRYSDKWNNGMETELWKDDSPDSTELDWALQWLAENFTSLWD
jgi:hypothetical protein